MAINDVTFSQPETRLRIHISSFSETLTSSHCRKILFKFPCLMWYFSICHISRLRCSFSLKANAFNVVHLVKSCLSFSIQKSLDFPALSYCLLSQGCQWWISCWYMQPLSCCFSPQHTYNFPKYHYGEGVWSCIHYLKRKGFLLAPVVTSIKLRIVSTFKFSTQ